MSQGQISIQGHAGAADDGPQHTCQVELIQQHPVALLDGLQQGPIAPGKVAGCPVRGWQVGSQQVHHVRLVAQVDAHQLVPCIKGHNCRAASACLAASCGKKSAQAQRVSPENCVLHV